MRVLKNKLKSLPKNPGVYLFKNASGEVIYAGKAKNLKNRVRSYFSQSHDLQPRTQMLAANIADLEYIICDTETESLILENNLIKKYLPRYNVLLKDDKNFQFIKIDYSTEIPQIFTVRKIENRPELTNLTRMIRKGSDSDNSDVIRNFGSRSKYFGPYTSGKSVRATLNLMRRILPYCGNKKISPRPCFYFHLGRCPGVCNGTISLEEYNRHLGRIKKFLSGDFAAILKELKLQMADASKKYRYEKAARLRDQIAALGRMLERQKIISPKRENFDVISIFAAGNLAAANLFQVREGRLVGKENFLLENAAAAPLPDLLQAFAEKYYLQASDIPPEICTQLPLPETGVLKKAIEEKLAVKIALNSPSRGRKKQLIKLGGTNAKDYLYSVSQNLTREQAVLTRALFELKDRLRLPELPFRIEAYDISNIMGTSPTGSLVVFENGKAKKSDYKRFAIKSLSTPNDVGMMKEVLSRRFAHTLAVPNANVTEANERSLFISLSGNQERVLHRRWRREVRPPDGRLKPSATLNQGAWRLPDLIVVDGGRAQLNVALAILSTKHLGLRTIPAIGLAKRREEIYLPEQKSPIRLPAASAALHLLQRIRDEAHRFAVAYHRKKRSKGMLE